MQNCKPSLHGHSKGKVRDRWTYWDKSCSKQVNNTEKNISMLTFDLKLVQFHSIFIIHKNYPK